jgi:hypothetical protein
MQPTAGTASISGMVIDDQDPGQPVRRAVVTLTGEGLRPRRGAITDDEGRFTIGGLPPGDYLVIALESLDAGGEIGEWQSPDVLTRLSGAASRVRVGQGQTATVELRSRPGL